MHSSISKFTLGFSFIVTVVIVFFMVNRYRSHNFLTGPRNDYEMLRTSWHTTTLDSGWDDQAFSIYRQMLQELNKKNDVRLIKFPIGGLIAKVSSTSLDSSFWDLVERGAWEMSTFKTFLHYISSDTIVIDFGTWIGPTILFNGQLAAKTYGIEADPAAFSRVSYNLKLNSQSQWYSRVHLQAGCVGIDSSEIEMKSAQPGNSMSSLHKFTSGSNIMRWMVRCYRLEELFTIWNIDPNAQHVFMKIDVESYECKLLPSLYSWLTKFKRKPTLFIAMHSQIVACSKEEYAMIAKIAKLYRFRSGSFLTGNNSVAGTNEHVLSDFMAPP